MDIERWLSPAAKYLYALASVVPRAPRCLPFENVPGQERSLEKDKSIHIPMEPGSL